LTLTRCGPGSREARMMGREATVSLQVWRGTARPMCSRSAFPRCAQQYAPPLEPLAGSLCAAPEPFTQPLAGPALGIEHRCPLNLYGTKTLSAQWHVGPPQVPGDGRPVDTPLLRESMHVHAGLVLRDQLYDLSGGQAALPLTAPKRWGSSLWSSRQLSQLVLQGPELGFLFRACSC